MEKVSPHQIQDICTAHNGQSYDVRAFDSYVDLPAGDSMFPCQIPMFSKHMQPKLER
jgi:hypothetical protein